MEIETLVCSTETFNKWRIGELVHITEFPQIDFVKPNTEMVEQEFCKKEEVKDSYFKENEDCLWSNWEFGWDGKFFEPRVVETNGTICTLIVAYRYRK